MYPTLSATMAASVTLGRVMLRRVILYVYVRPVVGRRTLSSKVVPGSPRSWLVTLLA